MTLGVEPNFYKPVSDPNADCNIHVTIFLGLYLKTSVIKVQRYLENDLAVDVFNGRNILELFNLLFKFLPEMRNLVKVHCNPNQFERLAEKAREQKRK